FRFNKKTGKTTETLKFWKNGDFEGIELVGDRIYTLQSDGDLISFEFKGEDVRKIRKEETKLSIKNDTEGLGYDPIDDVLLIACKQDGDLGDQKVKGRVVYAYNYHQRILKEDPVIQIRWETVRDFLKLHGLDIFINDSRRFRPSAIAVHPIDKHYYVLSTTGKSLIVFDRKGDIALYYTVPRNVMEQPEGICFDPNGDMYLSSEGEEEAPRIVKFRMKVPK
ncbi:MAG: SdiA-regulated domain-containing protein, partial [Bacteroidota bacterium]